MGKRNSLGSRKKPPKHAKRKREQAAAARKQANSPTQQATPKTKRGKRQKTPQQGAGARGKSQDAGFSHGFEWNEDQAGERKGAPRAKRLASSAAARRRKTPVVARARRDCVPGLHQEVARFAQIAVPQVEQLS